MDKKLIHASVVMKMRGRVRATARRVCPVSRKVMCVCGLCHPGLLGSVLYDEIHPNSLFSVWRASVVRDLALQTSASTPKIMAFSKSVVAASPQPTALTAEFRSAINVYESDGILRLVSVLGSQEGNTPAGNIKSVGFYYGSSATTTVGTGTLASLVNTLDTPKDSSIEVVFQYDVVLA